MGSAFRVITVRGIDIRLHITFPLILLWAAYSFSRGGGGVTGAVFGVIVIALLFVIVTLHELGHSFAAQYYGVPVKNITLLPIGGVAQLESIPEEPRKELVVAFAGPAVNFALAALFWLVAAATPLELVNPLAIDTRSITLNNVFAYTAFYNLFLGLFNLLPAFPMDGGRMLRAFLATRMQYARATRVAARVGRGAAWLLGLFGFATGNIALILIAFFIYMGAGQESSAVQFRSALRGVSVDQVYSREVNTLTVDDSLHTAVDMALSTLQTRFPVCDEDGRLLGIVAYQNLLDALRAHQEYDSVTTAMVRDVPFLQPEMELVDAQQVLAQSRLDALPVVSMGQFLGLLTDRDINEAYRLLTIDPAFFARVRPAYQPEPA